MRRNTFQDLSQLLHYRAKTGLFYDDTMWAFVNDPEIKPPPAHVFRHVQLADGRFFQICLSADSQFVNYERKQ